MSTKRFFWLFVGLLSMTAAMPSVTSAEERWREDRREAFQERWRDQREDRNHLVGRWYKDGSPCEIVSTRDGLEARNESGSTSKLVYGRDGHVRAVDWDGLRGEIRGNRIVWSNGTSWSRRRTH